MCQTHLRDAGGMRTGGLKRLGPCRTSVTHGHHQQGHQADDEVCTAGEKGAGSLESRCLRETRAQGRETVARADSALHSSAPFSLWPSSVRPAPGEADLAP